MVIQKANRDNANHILYKKIGGKIQWRAAVKAVMEDNNILG
jgi:hypothetical protein